MNTLLFIIVLLLTLYFVYVALYEQPSKKMKGAGSTSPGTMIQLTAKGVQDTHLTGYPEYMYNYNHTVPYYYNEWPEWWIKYRGL
jgi:hypothetical protein